MGGDFHCPSSFGGFGRVAPQDRGAGFGRGHRIHRMFQHQEAIRHANCQRTAGAAFADHRRHNRHFQISHHHQILGDGLGLAAFFGGEAGMCARRINQADNRQREFFGVAHHAHGFAVAFGVRHPEIAAHIFFGVVALLVADNHHTVFRHPPNATHQRLVI